MEKLNKIKQYIVENNFDLITDDYDILMWVDWGEFDEDIVRYCEETIDSGQLSAECIEKENDELEIGFETFIQYKDRRLKVKYVGEGTADRDSTIITLNKILYPDYDVRFCLDSDGSDTLAFLTLKNTEWNELISEFGNDKIDYFFMKVEENSKMFNVSMKEMSKRMKERTS